MNELISNAKYLPPQQSDTLSRKSGGEFSLAWDRHKLTDGFDAENVNRRAAYDEMYLSALADNDQELAADIKQQSVRNLAPEQLLDIPGTKETSLNLFEHNFKDVSPTEGQPLEVDLTAPNEIFGQTVGLQQKEGGINRFIDIEQEQLEITQNKIVALDKELEKIDGFLDSTAAFGGTALAAITHPAVLATLPLSFYASTGRAVVGATAAAFIGRNAMYTAGREISIAGLSEIYIQAQVYKYNQKLASKEKGIKRMTLKDATLNVLVNTAMAGTVGAAGSTVMDLSKIGWKGAAKFKTDENLESYIRTREASGVDTHTLTEMLKDSTFNREVDPIVVKEIKDLIDSSPSANITQHANNLNSAALQIDTDGYVKFQSDDISVPAQEAQAGDQIGIRTDTDEDFIAQIIKSDENTVTFKLGDEEVTIFRETGLSTDGKVYEAPLNIKPIPQEKNINTIDTSKPDDLTTPPTPREVDDLIEKYIDSDIEEVVEARRMDLEYDALEKELGIVRDGDIGDARKPKDADLTSHKDFNTLETTIKNPPKLESTRESNPAFKERIEAMDSEDEINAAWVERMQSGVDTTDVGYGTPQLGKKDLKEIKAGKGTPEQLEMLREDLKLMQSDEYSKKELPKKESVEVNEDGDIVGLDGNVLFAKGVPELFGGSVTGIEQDENGNWSIDPAKFVVGMLLGHTAKRIGKLGLDPKVQEDILRVLDAKAEDLVKQYPMLDVIPKLYAGSKAKGFKEAQAAGKTIGDTADKQEKFWIDDIGVTYDKDWHDYSMEHGSKGVKLSTILKHDELFKQYPELKDINIIFDKNKEGASFETTQINDEIADATITLGGDVTKDEANSVLLHEVQHSIQQMENFAKGGNMNEFQNTSEIARIENTFYKEIKEVEKKLNSAEERMFNAEFDNKKPSEEDVKLKKDALLEIDKIRTEMTRAGVKFKLDSYKALAGEQEARAVQAALKHPELDPYAALEKEEGKLKKPIVKKGNE